MHTSDFFFFVSFFGIGSIVFLSVNKTSFVFLFIRRDETVPPFSFFFLWLVYLPDCLLGSPFVFRLVSYAFRIPLFSLCFCRLRKSKRKSSFQPSDLTREESQEEHPPGSVTGTPKERTFFLSGVNKEEEENISFSEAFEWFWGRLAAAGDVWPFSRPRVFL